MSVKYHIKKYINPDSSKHGYYFAKAVHDESMSFSEVVKTIERRCSLRQSEVVSVVMEVVDVLTEALQAGKSVRIDGLGTFRLSLRSELVPTVDECTAGTITGMNVLFRPDYTIGKHGEHVVTLVDGVKVEKSMEYDDGVNDNIRK